MNEDSGGGDCEQSCNKSVGQLPKDEIFKPRLVVFLNDKLYRAQAKSGKTLPEWLLCPVFCRVDRVVVMLLS